LEFLKFKKNLLNFTNKCANKNEQDVYVQGLIVSKPVQSIRTSNTPEKSSKYKPHTYRYYVKADGEKKKKFARKLLLARMV
jgi:hypothetical protein